MKKVIYDVLDDTVIASFEDNSFTGKWDTMSEAYEDLLINFISNG